MSEGLHATITADSSQFVSAVDRARKSAGDLNKSLNAGLGFASKSFSDTTKASHQLAQSAAVTSGAFRTMKGASTQLGFQLQDIAVQAQMGTSAFTILGQQGSQIASLFGPGGALLGAVIAVASAVGGVLVASLGNARMSFDDLGEAVEGVVGKMNQQRIDSLTALIDQQKEKVAALRLEYQQAANAPVEELSTLQKVFKSQSEIRELQNERNRESVKNTSDAYKKYTIAEEQLQSLLNERTSLINQRDQFIEGDEAYSQRIKTLVWLNEIKEKELEDDQRRAGQRMSLFRQFDSMELAALQEKLTVKHNQLKAALEQEVITEQEYQALKLEANGIYLAEIDAQHERSAQNRAALEQSVTNSINRMRAGAMNNAVGLLQVLGQKNKAAAIAAIAVQKGLMISETWTSTLAAQLRAMAELGPIAGPPAAASIGLWGKANMALIAATGLAQAGSLGGGGGGGAGGVQSVVQSGTGAQQAAAAQRENQIVNISLEGEVFGRDQVRGLISQINDALDDGYSLRV